MGTHDEDDAVPLFVPRLPDPVAQKLACEACSATVSYLRVTTPESMPDFIHPLDDYAWIGWSWNEAHQSLTLVGTCSRACLVEWWRQRATRKERP